MDIVSDDAKAILLLCGHFDVRAGEVPLNQKEYNSVVRWLLDRKLRPSALLDPGQLDSLSEDIHLPRPRLDGLLKRGVQLGFAVERWQQSGLWVVGRSDPDYPARFKAHLKEKAPPILYGAGDRGLLVGGGLAIVGSRNVDAEGEAFTRFVADWCGRMGVRVVSGGARGVDSIAMASGLEAGGAVVGVLADSLLRKSVSRDARDALADGRLVLFSPYHPEAGFSVGNAMGRNKLIYAMADYGLVVSSDHKKGGTWEGAVEELKRDPRRPLFVRMSGKVPAGNRKLLDMGAVVFPDVSPKAKPEVLEEAAKPGPRTVDDPMPLFATANRKEAPSLVFHEKSSAYSKESAGSASGGIYQAVLPLLLESLANPSTVEELAVKLDVTKPQLNQWIKRALADRRIEKLNRPVRYRRLE